MGQKLLPPHDPYTVFGTAGQSMNDTSFSKKFGKKNTRVGKSGEELLFKMMRGRGGWLPPEIPLYCSLRIPDVKYNIDSDFAICNGNRVLLIDAKYWKQSSGFLWNISGDGDNMFEGLRRWKSNKGEPYSFSRSMVTAKDVFKRKLPGYQVEAIVVLVTGHGKNTRLPNTWFLRAPGGIKVFNNHSAQRYIRSFLRGTKRTEATRNAEILLERCVQ